MYEQEKELAGMIAGQCKDMTEVQELIKNIFKDSLESMLQGEMDEYLGYEKSESIGKNSGNSRNGYNRKKLQSEFGEVELNTPRDRNGDFEPKVIGKYQTKTENLEERVIAMYAKGMSTRDIEDHLRDIYGVEASAGLISRITDKILPAVMEWQSRPLESIYPVVYFDGIMFKVRKEGKIINKCVYTVLGIDMTGRKDILGLWVSDTESAAFWTTVCNELKNRGVTDILIACHDNLNELSRAVNTVFPKTEQQLCIIHQIRNSTRYVTHKDVKAVLADLKKVYTAPTLDDAEYRLEEFKEQWDGKYPQIGKSWDDNWAELSTFFKYPEEVRKLIYTTNAVEGFHRMLRKFTKTKTIYPTDDALRKSVYLSIQEITKKWCMPVHNWGIIMGQLIIFFPDRFSKNVAS